MNKKYYFVGLTLILALHLVFAPEFSAQRGGTETYSGTIVSFGSGLNTRTVTRTFTLRINRRTSDQEARNFLSILQENGQEELLREIRDEDLGYFSVGANIGRRLNVVRESVVNGQRRIFIVFERWLQFAELRGGYRSTDYPFGVIELSIDERTGRGEGTYIAAARIRWDRDRRGNQEQVEIENFATFPARLMGVTRRNGR
jgi:hypothetical protein